MKPKITKSGKPIDEHELVAFEKRLGVELPQGYRKFLLKHNGGCPKPSKFDYLDHGKKRASDVKCFIPLVGGEYNLAYYLDWRAGRLPEDYLPIGEDYFGNLVCLGLSGKERGKLYFWDHDQEEDPDDGGDPSANLFPIPARDFDEFVGSLQEFKEKLDPLEIFIRDCTVQDLLGRLDKDLQVNSETSLGFSLAKIAMYFNRKDLLKVLLEKGASRQDLLHIAANGGKIDVMQMLLDAGESVDALSSWNPMQSPLHCAVLMRRESAVEFLLKKGANPNLKPSYGETILESALSEGDKDIIELLRKSGAK
ncbi:MAG: ankyrin repeat domain-containing protein [Planctomycetota bacterium]|nr:ankyrin repeat domain-containing protein [Planctomycetota bacterium]